MRVITPYGLGEAEGLWSAKRRANVRFDTPFLGKECMELSRGEIFPFSSFAQVRVLNVEGVGLVSHLQFFQSSTDLETASWKFFPPPNETEFKLYLDCGLVTATRPLGLLVGRYIIVRPWVDRWAIERSTFEGLETGALALAAWTAQGEACAGTSGGIAASACLDLERRNVIGFRLMLAPPQGTVFEWRPS